MGTGILYAGMNDAKVHDNWIFDNWRDGVMLLAVPDPLVKGGGAEGDIFPGVSCPGAATTKLSTSCGNRFYNNKMGQVPPGFKFPAEVDQFTAFASRSPIRQKTMPNGNDFWWDEFSGNTKNCWFGNTGPDGRMGSVTGPGQAGRSAALPPAPLPDCSGGSNPGNSLGLGDVAKTQYLVECSEGPDKDTGPLDCDWWSTPPKPGSAAARRGPRNATAAASFARSAKGKRLKQRIEASDPADDVRPDARHRRRGGSLPVRGRLRRLGRAQKAAAPKDTRTAEAVGPRIAGSVVQYADCGDWTRGTRRERDATVDELRDQLTAQSERDTTSPLPDERAYRILQKSCSQSYAGSLRLYKLFAKAQGYAALGE